MLDIRRYHSADHDEVWNLHLDTSVVQVAAQKLYMKNGFKETGREIHRGLECILFEKSIG